MYRAFLSIPKTVPCRDGDFVEWHNGISHYGFWAVVVKDPAWIALCDGAREHVKAFVHPGYQRAPHITVIACGLFDGNHFSAEQLNRQKAALSEMRISPFHLVAGPLNSFTTGPYLAVEDPAGTISRIRDRLAMISAEDTPVRYEPHITLGLYRDAFDTAEVADCLAGFTWEPVGPMLAADLSFCLYETKKVQGRFDIIEGVKLNAHVTRSRETRYPAHNRYHLKV
ncbi:MAG: hypothetical protein A4E60_03393 [Syntrophorhabdus sp. PtaB.Bin047]|nr:MAG: hypothetical protein A4E60_03393 [Syntrophorhabdus sp. PtaB.Bin047]